MANYYCEHCGKKFEAPETIVQRCPACFWTTSVHLVGESTEQESGKPKKTAKLSPKLTFSGPSPRLLRIIATVVAGLCVVWIVKTIFQQSSGIVKNAKSGFQKKETPSKSQKSTNADFSNQKSAPVVLSDSDNAILMREIKLEIPRLFTGDELEILNRRVEFPFQGQQFQKSKAWTLDEFEAFLAKQQKIKGIYFSWGYERKLAQLFKERYLKADDAISKNDYESARSELIQALVFPIYSNNILHHKAVALVMLQPYINDVLGKIKQLNMHLLLSRVKNAIDPLRASYESLFVFIEDKEIEKAVDLVESLEKDIDSINWSAKQTQIDYPPTVAQIDSDIRRGIDLQDESLEPVSAGLNSVLADLRIKKKVLSQNLPGSLRATQQDYQTALSAIRDKKWQEALLALEKIQFPPELADDARQKEAVIRKLTG